MQNGDILVLANPGPPPGKMAIEVEREMVLR